MAWTSTVDGMKLVTKLDDGQTSTGAVKTVNVNMGTLNKDGWDLQKAGAIIQAFNSNHVFDRAIISVIQSVDNYLENE